MEVRLLPWSLKGKTGLLPFPFLSGVLFLGRPVLAVVGMDGTLTLYGFHPLVMECNEKGDFTMM